jgi:peptide-methionine (S)-S-oxide reductase
MDFFGTKTRMIDPDKALPGRDAAIAVPSAHAVLGTPMTPPFPADTEQVVLGLGCFWGAERLFWQTPGVHTTAVGYAGGYTQNPTYEEVCSGRTGHTEVVLVVYRPDEIPFEQVLKVFWEGHDPTQGMRQGNDVGTQYRSAIFVEGPDRLAAAESSKAMYERQLRASGYDAVSTEIAPAGPFFYAEDYHQQYLHKVPNGYCGLGGTGVSCPIGLGVAGSEG